MILPSHKNNTNGDSTVMASELHVDAIKHSGGTSAITIDSSGWYNKLVENTFYWRLVPSANVDIADSSWTQVAFDTTLYDSLLYNTTI